MIHVGRLTAREREELAIALLARERHYVSVINRHTTRAAVSDARWRLMTIRELLRFLRPL